MALSQHPPLMPKLFSSDRLMSVDLLRRINAVLTLACLIVGGAVAVSFGTVSHRGLVTEIKEGAAVVEPFEDITVAAPATAGQTSQIHNLFAPRQDNAGSDPRSRYKVTGIILDGRAQAVLKDLQSGKSLFVFKGDRLGEALINDIQEGKVVLSSNQQSWELRP